MEPIRAAGCVVWRRSAGEASMPPSGLGSTPEDSAETVPAPRTCGDIAAGASQISAVSDVELVLVHRPRYDDWSFPKGKVEPEERDDPLRAALREVSEETGLTCTPAMSLPTQHYLVDGHPKEVRYWAAEATGGVFAPNEEVDRLAWVSAAEARTLLTYAPDRRLVDALLAALRERSGVGME